MLIMHMAAWATNTRRAETRRTPRPLKGVANMRGSTLVALLAVQACGALGGTPLKCGTETDLVQNEQAMHEVCVHQMGEEPGQGGDSDQFPNSCSTRECARVVNRIVAGCSALLQQGFFADTKRRFDIVTAKCNQPGTSSVTTFPVYSMVNLTSTGDNSEIQLAGTGDAQLVDNSGAGNGQGNSYFNQQVKIFAPQGQTVQLSVTMMWLGGGTSSLTVYDGNTTDAPRLTAGRLSGFARPSAPLNSTGNVMLVQVLWEPEFDGSLTAWTLDVGSRCKDSASCGAHGTCGPDSRCSCSGKYTGPTCADTSCLSQTCESGTCGRHCTGSICTPGVCICDTGFRGPHCSKKIGPCSETDKWIVLGDDNAWRASRGSGSHCDAPDLHDGRRGPFTPLSKDGKSQWYRFTGKAGVGLVTTSEQGPAHLGPWCMTGGGGWLTNYSAPFGNPPVSWNAAGSYPTAEAGIQMITICFSQAYQPCATATRAQVITCVASAG